MVIWVPAREARASRMGHGDVEVAWWVSPRTPVGGSPTLLELQAQRPTETLPHRSPETEFPNSPVCEDTARVTPVPSRVPGPLPTPNSQTPSCIQATQSSALLKLSLPGLTPSNPAKQLLKFVLGKLK